MRNESKSSERTSRCTTGFQRSPDQAKLAGKELLCVAAVGKKHLCPNHPLRLVAFLTAVMSAQASFQQEFVQANILDGGPDDGEATGLGGEEEHYTLSPEFRVSIIALRRIICPVFKNEGYFMAVHLAVVRGVRELQEYFFSDGEVSPLLSGKVLFNKPAIGTSKVVEGVGV